MQKQGTIDKSGEMIAPQPRVPKTGKPKPEVKSTGSIISRLVQFKDEVRAELKKVVWPNRPEVTSYSTIVLMSVVIIGALIFGLDYGFIKVVQMLFNS
jgi:preprotein translocase subunit SecE